MNLTERVRIRKAIATVAIGNPERRVHKALHRGSKQQLRLCVAISLIIACSRHAYIFLFFVHILFVVNHTINATPPERLQQHPLLFTTTNHTDRTFFVWRLNSAWPPHPGHSTILLRSEILSGICAKLRTMAASNNRDHASQSVIVACSRHAYILLFFAHILFVVNHTINATPPERLQHYTLIQGQVVGNGGGQ